MTTLIFTNINHYLTTHEAFKIDNLIKWAEQFSVYFFVRRLDSSPIIENKWIKYSSISPNSNVLKFEISQELKSLKPKKVVNLLEKFFPWDLVETDAEKIYFVRSCAAKLYQVLKTYDADQHTLDLYHELVEREYSYIKLSDKLITDSPNSVAAITEMYNRSSDTCLEYINPTKYNTISNSELDLRLVYNVGRRDFQKALHFVKVPETHTFISIGKFEVGQQEYIAPNIRINDCVVFDQYKNLILNAAYGIFPSIWESNGYTVQECLSMGKIPVIQINSGGNERLCNKNNSILLDFNKGNTDWEYTLSSISKTELMLLREYAKSTITYDMYSNSLEKFGNLIC